MVLSWRHRVYVVVRDAVSCGIAKNEPRRCSAVAQIAFLNVVSIQNLILEGDGDGADVAPKTWLFGVLNDIFARRTSNIRIITTQRNVSLVSQV